MNFGSPQGAVTGMVIAADGVYLAGQVNGALPGQTNAGAYAAFAIKYDLNGKSVWTREFGTADGDYVRAIAVAPGALYILGITQPSNAPISSFFIRRSDTDGNEVWTRHFNDATLMDLWGASADSTGVYFFGQTMAAYPFVRKFDSAGNDRWTHELDDSQVITGIASDEQGAYVAFFGPDLGVRRIDLNGSETWRREYVSSSYTSSIAADATGFYLSGVANAALPGQCYAGQGDVFLMRFDKGGNPLWTREFGTAGFDRQAQISVGASEVDVTGSQSPSDTIDVTRIEKSSSVTDSTPRILWNCVLNSGSYLGGGVAPGEIVTILGSAMGPPDIVKLQPTSDGHIPTSLAGARILFNGGPAPLIYVSARQSSAIVPYDVAGKSSVDVQVEYNGVQSAAVTVPVFDSRLGVFSYGTSGSGQAAIVNEDGTINSSFNPAARGSVSVRSSGIRESAHEREGPGHTGAFLRSDV